MSGRPPTVTLFCGASTAVDPAYFRVAEEAGRFLGQRGIGVVYGGGTVGLMGAAADAALKAGTPVTGVIPAFLVEREGVMLEGAELEVVGSMMERKHRMAQLADAFVVLPGGLGTLDEVFEILTWTQLGLLRDKPLGFLNPLGFFDGLFGFLRELGEKNFIPAASAPDWFAAPTMGRLWTGLAARWPAAPGSTAPD